MRSTPVRVLHWRRIKIVFPFLFSVSGVAAQPSQLEPNSPATKEAVSVPSTDVKVTWADIVRLIDKQPKLTAGQLRLEAARSGVNAAVAVPNPTLEGTLGRGVARTSTASSFEWGLALTMPLSWVVQRGSRMDAAKADVNVAEAENTAIRRDVLLQLQRLFWQLAYEQSRVTSLEDLEAQTLALAKTVRSRVESGESRPIEVTRVEIEAEKVTSELETARASRSSQQAQLALWLQVPPDKTIVVMANMTALPTSMERGAAISKALATHPLLKVTQAQLRALEANVTVEKRARVPAVNLTGFATSELDRRAFGFGVSVDVPLWNWNSGRIAQAKSKVEASRKEAEATNLELLTSVVEAQADCQASLATTLSYRNNILPRSETAASITARTYQLGEANLLEALDARRTLLDAQRHYLSALAKAQIDCSRLRAMVGEEHQ